MMKSVFATEKRISTRLIHTTAKRFCMPYVINDVEIIETGDRFDMVVSTDCDDLTLWYLINWQFLGIAMVENMTYLHDESDDTSTYIVHFVSAYHCED